MRLPARVSAPVVWALVWSAGSRVLAGVSVLLVNVYLARRLGPVEFGTVAVVMSVATFGAVVVAAGTNRFLLRNVAASLATDRSGQVSEDLRGAFRLLLWSIPAGALATYLLSAYFIRHADEIWSASLSGALVAVGAGLMLVFADLLRGLGEVPFANLGAGRNGGALATSIFVAFLAIVGERRLTSAQALNLNALALLLALAMLYIAFRRVRPAELRAQGVGRGLPGRLLVLSSMTFMGSQLAFIVGSQVELWIGSGSLSQKSVGVYAAAFRLMGFISMPLFAAQLMVSGRFAALRAQGRMDDLQRLARRAAAIIAIPSVLLLLPCVIMPAQILSSLYGKRYSGGAFVLGALALAQLVNVLTGLCGVVLGMCSKESILLRVSVLWACVSVIAEIIGVRIGGMNGLALASALTTSGQFITLWVLTRTELGIWTHPGLTRSATRG